MFWPPRRSEPSRRGAAPRWLPRPRRHPPRLRVTGQWEGGRPSPASPPGLRAPHAEASASTWASLRKHGYSGVFLCRLFLCTFLEAVTVISARTVCTQSVDLSTLGHVRALAIYARRSGVDALPLEATFNALEIEADVASGIMDLASLRPSVHDALVKHVSILAAILALLTTSRQCGSN